MRALNKHFYHQTVGTAELTEFCNRFSGHDLSKIFEQYLGTTQVPVFEYTIHGGVLRYRWTNCVKGFDLPPPVKVDGKQLRVDRNFYVKVSSVPAF